MTGHRWALAALVEAVPLFAPSPRAARGRVSATGVPAPGAAPDRVVVDFGWHSPSARLDLEVTTRRWDGASGAQPPVRALCAERDFMQRLVGGAGEPTAPGAAPDAVWSVAHIALDGAARPFTVLTTAHSWVAATALEGGWLLRLFAPAAPAGLALERVRDAAALEPLGGRP